MLTAEQIGVLRDSAEKLLDPITEYLLDDIAKRVAAAGQFTGTASYQVWRLQELGLSQRQIKKEIAKRLKISLKETEKLLTQVAKTGYNFDMSRFPTKHGIPFSANSSLQQILQATVQLAKEDLTNITQTIGFVGPDGKCRKLTDAYNQACDFAFQKASTGGQDYWSAIREATKNLADQGIRVIDYESGTHVSIEAAVRRNIMGGAGLMQEQISQLNHDELGCDGWEISAHAASAFDHEPFQGRQYTDAEYYSLNNSLVRRIGTLNCAHSSFPIILGVNAPQYTADELEQFRKENEEGITIGGKHYTLYEATQRQRKYERKIRKQRHKILVAEGLNDKEQLQTAQIKMVRLQEEYVRFSKDAKLPLQHARMEVAGFNWKHATAAEKAVNGQKSTLPSKNVEIPQKPATIDPSQTPISSTADNTPPAAAENSEVAALHYVTRLDIEKYKCVSENITTDEVIMTDERIQHIQEHHPNDFERYERYIKEIIENPDYILEANKPNTAFILKKIQEGSEHFELILRLAVQGDPEGYKNSVITFLKVEEKRYNRYLRTKKILYKSE